VGWSLKPPSERFPSGYGKIESLGALGVSGILLGGGLLPHSHGHHHGGGDLGPNINAAWLAAGSIVIKEWLYRASKCSAWN
jgi:divalent metal cation (Fe/Co/Zn/Cd) transporter